MRRLPPLAVYKKVADFEARAARRFVSGVMAALLALGLIQAGVVVIPLPRGGDLTNAFARCAQGCGWAQASLLFGAGMILGFSERLLTSLGDSLVPTQAKVAERATRDDAGGA
jgi:hypothetical protein